MTIFRKNHNDKIKDKKSHAEHSKEDAEHRKLSDDELDRYMYQLIGGELRLRDLPSELRESEYTHTLHVCAFRASRHSIILYDSDLCFVREEIMMAKGKRDWHLVKILEHIFETYANERSWVIDQLERG